MFGTKSFFELSCKSLLFLAFCNTFLASGCNNTSPDIPFAEMHEIYDRNHRPMYRARMPQSWISRKPLHNESLDDTTKPIAEFIIREEKEMIRISVHNFPSDKIEERIPPNAQVARWQRQFDNISYDSSTISQAFSGYSGLMFIGKGVLQSKETMMIAWSLQLFSEHYRTLSNPLTNEDQNLFRQMRADVTIKAIGPTPLMEKHQAAIIAFARSFELIEEVPSRS